GTGDLIDSSVAGANYGYAMLWVLAVGLVTRYVVVSTLGKYQLCNGTGDETILAGYGRIWRGLPMVLGLAGMFLGFVYASYLARGAGTALYHLFGEVGGPTWGVFLWSCVAVAAAVWLCARRHQYTGLERVAQVAVVAIVGAFLVGAAGSGVKPVELVQGLAFELPADKGPVGALVVLISVIGTVGGSASNLIYPYLMRDKGWVGPAYRRLQNYDLLLGVLAILIINVAVWVVAAETLGGREQVLGTETDLALMMELAVGQVGPVLLWVAIFFVTFDNLPAYSYGFTRMFFDGLHQLAPRRAQQYVGGDGQADPWFRPLQIGALVVLPLVFALPAAPDVIVLTVIGNTFAVLTTPIIVFGLLWLTNSKRLMLPGHTNRWWENLILLASAVIGCWASYQLVQELAALVAT
ncbi:MAG: Nramp family divalent metal transporter, partial [Nocardioidaceae bacterium]